MFNSQVPLAGQLAQGLNVSRKVNGVWSTIVAGDNTFVYAPGRPFDVRFAKNGGACTLTASLTDNPATVYHWSWADLAKGGSRVGLAIWDMPDAHFAYLRASSLAASAPVEPLKITKVTVSGGNVVRCEGSPGDQHVERRRALWRGFENENENENDGQSGETHGDRPRGPRHRPRLRRIGAAGGRSVRTPTGGGCRRSAGARARGRG